MHGHLSRMSELRHVAPPTARLTSLPTYVFARLDELKSAARLSGAELIDLGIGNPDQPTPRPITDAIAVALADPLTHGYPPFRGTPAFLKAAARYMQRRFGVTVDAEREVLAVSGGKEGIAHLTMAFTDERSVSLVPNIYYPVHARATMLAGGRVHFLPLTAAGGFLPDLAAVPAHALDGARMLLLNYPHNPTGAVATLEFFEEAVAFAARRGLVLLSDLAYAELGFDGFVPPSVLEVGGSRDVAIEFHSCSKTFNMAGARIGFAAGNADLIAALYDVRTNMGYGSPSAAQAGAEYAFDHVEEYAPAARARYQARRDVTVAGFRSLGWEVPAPRATMFVWLPVPAGFTSEQWTEALIARAGVVVTPGSAFGPGGEGFFRVSLVADEARLSDAVERLRAAGVSYR